MEDEDDKEFDDPGCGGDSDGANTRDDGALTRMLLRRREQMSLSKETMFLKLRSSALFFELCIRTKKSNDRTKTTLRTFKSVSKGQQRQLDAGGQKTPS